MEIILIILCVILALTTAYFASDARASRRWIEKQDEWITILKDERTHWQNKVLAKQGILPLGQERKEPKKPEFEEITPRIAHRAQLRKRVEATDSAITVHATGARYPARVQETLDKAKEILRPAEKPSE